MSERYNLTQMLAEIEQDEQVSAKKYQLMSQLEIRELFKHKRRKGKAKRDGDTGVSQ